jgi:hypothetical protein
MPPIDNKALFGKVADALAETSEMSEAAVSLTVILSEATPQQLRTLIANSHGDMLQGLQLYLDIVQTVKSRALAIPLSAPATILAAQMLGRRFGRIYLDSRMPQQSGTPNSEMMAIITNLANLLVVRLGPVETE